MQIGDSAPLGAGAGFGEEQGSVKLPIRLVTHPASPAYQGTGMRALVCAVCEARGGAGA